jgi:hypothetical protein
MRKHNLDTDVAALMFKRRQIDKPSYRTSPPASQILQFQSLFVRFIENLSRPPQVGPGPTISRPWRFNPCTTSAGETARARAIWSSESFIVLPTMY